MSFHDIVSEEYLLFDDPLVQGNVNAPGLQFEEELSSSLFALDQIYNTSIEVLESTINFIESFSPSHEGFCDLSDSVNLVDIHGSPVRVNRARMLVAHKPRVSPVDLALFYVDLVHGVDVYYQDVVEVLLVNSSPVVSERHEVWVDEPLNIFFVPVPGKADVYVRLSASTFSTLSAFDLATREYILSNSIVEYLGPYDSVSFGRQLYAHSSISLLGVVLDALGYSFNEFVDISSSSRLSGDHVLCADSELTLHSTLFFQRIYEAAVDENIQIDVGPEVFHYLAHLVGESIGFFDLPEYGSSRFFSLIDKLAIASSAKIASICSEAIYDGIAVSDDGSVFSMYSETVTSPLTVAIAQTIMINGIDYD